MQTARDSSSVFKLAHVTVLVVVSVLHNVQARLERKLLSWKKLRHNSNTKKLLESSTKEITPRTDLFPTTMVKGAAFLPAYQEVSGACAGCGETHIIVWFHNYLEKIC